MATCAGITVGADYDCIDPLVPFVRQRLLVGNLEDIDTITRNSGFDNIIEDIKMKTGKAMFAFEGVKQASSAQAELVVQTLSNAYNHQCNLSVFEVDSAQKRNRQGMAALPQFCLVENSKDTSLGDSVFEIFVINRGLEASELIRINGDTDTGGAYVITLITPDEGGKESNLPESFFLTSLAVTEALVEALLIPAI